MGRFVNIYFDIIKHIKDNEEVHRKEDKN